MRKIADGNTERERKRKRLRKGIVILISLVLAVTATMMMMVPQVEAAAVIVHDHPTESRVKPKDECLEVINATDGVLAGIYVDMGENVWLRGRAYGTPTGSVTVNSTIVCNVVYIQFHSSDDNDGIADIYVDDMDNPIARIDTYNRSHWYVEIRGLSDTLHTVRVNASDHNDFTDVIVSPHHATPDIDHTGDLDVWYFCFAKTAVGGIWIPVDKLGLLAPYISLASTILVATAATAIYVKRRKKKQ